MMLFKIFILLYCYACLEITLVQTLRLCKLLPLPEVPAMLQLKLYLRLKLTLQFNLFENLEVFKGIVLTYILYFVLFK